MKNVIRMYLGAAVLLISCFAANAVAEAPHKYNVLVVMSYEKPEANPWCMEIKDGIDSVLADSSAIDYLYMDTKVDYAGGNQKAKDAYALYNKKRYDGVIAADDNAQKMFVVPYLKDKTETPVMFCGVNADPATYGYPAANVSGMIERGHFRESISLLKQLIPQIGNVGFVVKESPSGAALQKQIESEAGSFLADVVAFEQVKTLQDIKNNPNLDKCDAFFVDSLEGILDDQGKVLGNIEVISFLTDTYGKPIIGANNSHVFAGALCAVVKTGQEQGIGAAKKLLAAMQDTPVADIPITKNFEGKRVINLTVMKDRGLRPKPITLLGADLVRTTQ